VGSTSYSFLAIMVLSCTWMVVTMVRIAEVLRRRGEKVSFLWLRVMIFHYLARYRRITVRENGRPGPLYGQFVASALLTLTSALMVVWALRGSG
jgi:hypothetical protein